MPRPKPCLGYPSRSEAIVALRSQGLTTAEIAARTGIDAKAVGALEASAMRSMARTRAKRQTIGVMLPPRIMEALKPHAARRRVTPAYLAFRIVETAVADKLIDSILDDLGEDAAA
jgi:hypothetical protein